jgi:hypothetical protein
MSKNKVVNASSIGKTAYCPHAAYLSEKYPPGKASQKRMAQGTKKHNALTKSVGKPLPSIRKIVVVGVLIWLVYSWIF